MVDTHDGPSNPAFRAVPCAGGLSLDLLRGTPLSAEMLAALPEAPSGDCVSWGIPFRLDGAFVVSAEAVEVGIEPFRAEWLVFAHTSDLRPVTSDASGFISPMTGQGRLDELAATYVVTYQDGTTARLPVRRRREIGAFQRQWGENCFQAVAHHKPRPLRAHHEQPCVGWGRSQTRASAADSGDWVNWLWAWRNPEPAKAITGLRLEPGEGAVLFFGLAAGRADAHPLRWQPRRTAVLTLPEGMEFDATLDDRGLSSQLRMDMGQVISAARRPIYPHDDWDGTYNNQLPTTSAHDVLVEYTAHPEALFHLWDGRTVAVTQLDSCAAADGLRPVTPVTQRVTLRVVDKGSGRAVPVKLHLHGVEGQYLSPVDRHRIPNPAWFEDYSCDFVHAGQHYCTYIPGETRIDLPLGRVYIEVSKGFEVRPVRTVAEVRPDTDEVVVELEKVLPWRERGWVTADTHVHFLSPMTALLEGAGEGVNVVNLLASQWGELMTNVGDFDGRTTWGSREAGGDGEYLVRVGTENRQHVMGHISLLGYSGDIIAPMTTGGPDESALGDPIEVLLTEWAQRCRRQGGLVVLPHFPNPRAENAASIVEGVIDGVEMTSWGSLYAGINPYSLSDWYRYLNCGYLVGAVAGTDKMTALTAVGTVRTYANVSPLGAFTYENWMAAVRRAHTFVTYGPLLEFAVDGQPMGSRLRLGRGGGTVDVTWQVASVTAPMSRVELVVNGEIRESVAVDGAQAAGTWSVRVERSSWLALLVRGHYPDQPEIVAAHSSPVMVELEGSAFYSAADAVTILEQIEGALAYVDTVGTRAETRRYKEMRLVLEGAHRRLHNRMHAMGNYHEHSPEADHAEHR